MKVLVFLLCVYIVSGISPKYCKRPGRDCPGFGEIESRENVDSLYRCRRGCDLLEECKMVQYNPKTQQCWLKRDICENSETKTAKGDMNMVKADDCTPYKAVASKYCKRPHLDCEGFGYLDSYNDVDSLYSCRRFCDEDKECKMVQYRADTKQCWTKGDICKNSEMKSVEGDMNMVKAADCTPYKPGREQRPTTPRPTTPRPTIGKKPENGKIHFCRRDGLGCAGFGTIKLHTRVASTTDCAKLCAKTEECKMVQYKPQTKDCFTKRDICDNSEMEYADGEVNLVRADDCTPYDDAESEITSNNNNNNNNQGKTHFCTRDKMGCAFFGDIERHDAIQSAEDCARLCADNSECKMAQYYSPTKQCWLKRDICANSQMKMKDGDVNMVKADDCSPYDIDNTHFCTRDKMGCAFFGDMGRHDGVSSQEDCARLCAYNSECKMAQYYSPTKQCWLKRDICANSQMKMKDGDVNMVKADDCTPYELSETNQGKSKPCRKLFGCKRPLLNLLKGLGKRR